MDYYQSLKRGSEIDNAVTYVNEELPQKVNDIEEEIAELKSSKLDKTSYNTNVYTKEEVNAKLSSVYFYKGTKTVDEINAISVYELTAGWTYNVSDSGKITVGSQAVTVHQGDNVSWTGEFWDKLASDIDLSAYYTKTEVEDYVDATIDEKSLTADDDDSGNVTLQIAAATDIDGKDSEIDTYFFEDYPKIYRIQDSMDSLYDTSIGYYILFVTSEHSSLDMTNLTRQYKFQNGSMYTRLGNPLNVDDVWSDWKEIDGNMTDVKVNGTSVVTGGVANIPIASDTTLGVIKTSLLHGLSVDDQGNLSVEPASETAIDDRVSIRLPIIPSNLDYAVRSVYPIVKDYVDSPTSTTLNTIYNLGVQSSPVITLPAAGQLGSFIQVDFISGTTPTTLYVTSSAGILGFDLIPEANMIYSLYFDWGIISSAGSYGWRCTYSEYDISTIGG